MAQKNDRMGMEAVGIVGTILSCIALLVVIGHLIAFSANIATSHTIDSRIAMCQEENAVIEQKISLAISNYLEHEKDIIVTLSPEDALVLLAAYPELKADTLISKQIDIYLENTEEIKSLKEAKIDISVKKWWVYFGS